MITVFVTKEGYYINGDGVEATLRCSPALDDHGKPIFPELHHTYKVMYLALKAIIRLPTKVQSDVIVYNDSRIIDELSGFVPPFDDVCQKWQQSIRREVIAHIRSLVSFRKKPKEFLQTQFDRGQTLLTSPKDMKRVQEIVEKNEQQTTQSKKMRILDKFRKMWNNDKK